MSDCKQDQLLHHLKRGGTTSGLEAIKDFGLYRLSSAVHLLRKAGHNIETEMVTTEDGQYARYRLTA